ARCRRHVLRQPHRHRDRGTVLRARADRPRGPRGTGDVAAAGAYFRRTTSTRLSATHRRWASVSSP
ncbi:MAG: hypothetical protein ACK55I_49790, partial [bacterium]